MSHSTKTAATRSSRRRSPPTSSRHCESSNAGTRGLRSGPQFQGPRISNPGRRASAHLEGIIEKQRIEIERLTAELARYKNGASAWPEPEHPQPAIY